MSEDDETYPFYKHGKTPSTAPSPQPDRMIKMRIDEKSETTDDPAASSSNLIDNSIDKLRLEGIN